MAIEFNRYINTAILVDSKKKRRYYESNILPTISKNDDDTYIITTIGDRLDNLAYEYYKSLTAWWVIAIANPEYEFSSFYLPPGIQIRIPGGRFKEPFYLEEFTRSLNKNR